MLFKENKEDLSSFFQQGIDAEDISALFPLRRAQEALKAFITLFRGGDEEVLIRLLVLREIGARGERPRWSPQELRTHFLYLDDVKLETVLQRLSENGLLTWEAETGDYQVSPAGRMALAAIVTLLKFSDEGAELGYITAQLAASQAVGRVSSEELQHLLSRLNELQDEFNRAVLSGSEHRIRQAEQKLNAVWQWVEKGTDVIHAIAADSDLDVATHRVAQRIGQAQSQMLRMGAVFQRTLNQLESHQVHLGASGLSSADINQWLRAQTAADIAALIADGMQSIPRLAFFVEETVLDVAEWELMQRTRSEGLEENLPPPLDAPAASEIITAEEDLEPLMDWVGELRVVSDGTLVEEQVPAGTYSLSAYRLSLLALLGDPESRSLSGPVAELARLPMKVTYIGEVVPVGRAEVAEMSSGRLERNSQEPGRHGC